MADGPNKGAEVKSPEHSLQARIQNEAKKIIIDPNCRNDEGQPLVRPDGPISILGEQEWKIVRTKAFKEWFGDWENPDNKEVSKIVGSNGEPLVAYHDSPVTFDRFDESLISSKTDEGFFGKGFYFHSTDLVSPGIFGGPRAKRVACFLNIKKPFFFTDEVKDRKDYYKWLFNRDRQTALEKARKWMNLDGLKAELKELDEGKTEKYHGLSDTDLDRYYAENPIANRRRLSKIIRSYSNASNHLDQEYKKINESHDGIIVANEEIKLDERTREIVAFKNEQILILKWE